MEGEVTQMATEREGEDGWLPDDVGAALLMEKQLNPDETEEQSVKRLFREASPHAAMSIIRLAQTSTNERTRLDASKYVVERVIGKIGEDEGGVSSPIDDLMGDVISHLQAQSQTAQGQGMQGGDN